MGVTGHDAVAAPSTVPLGPVCSFSKPLVCLRKTFILDVTFHQFQAVAYLTAGFTVVRPLGAPCSTCTPLRSDIISAALWLFPEGDKAILQQIGKPGMRASSGPWPTALSSKVAIA